MTYHKPVLVDEVLAQFQDSTIQTFFDATLGAGGHAKAILEAHPEIERYFGCDRDPNALLIAKKELEKWGDKLELIYGSYGEMVKWLQQYDVRCVDGVLIDAGVSSMQLDWAQRGFSFQADGPLDMRMDPDQELSAAYIVNRYREDEIYRILKEYGEEPRARAIARQIVKCRKVKSIKTTLELVQAIRPVARGKKHLHPATLTFQGLRIAVNDELNVLERGIEKGIEALCLGGKILVISFHRLEDRIAKNSFRKMAKEDGSIEILTKKPLAPSEKEIRENPRSRSAKLRAAKKVD
jgi:16S rRNA (cytosine1402-N4)-methyltransferase